MAWGSVPSERSALSVLVVAPDGGVGAAVGAGVDALGASLRVAHARTLPAALGALAGSDFDCVLADLGFPDLEAVEVTRALRSRCGSAGLVVAVESPLTPPELGDLADVVLRPADLAADWLSVVRRAADHARLRTRLQVAEQSVARLNGVVDSVGDAVFTIDLTGTVTSWNGGAEVLYGYRAAEMIGVDASVLQPSAAPGGHRRDAMSGAGGPVRGLETVLRTRDGELAEVAVDVSPLYDDRGELSGYVVVGRDVTDRRELESELVRQTMHDVLTGLPNRAFLTYRLTQALASGRRRGSPVAALIVDLDQFKAVQDLHGHLVGDRLLVEVADRLRAVARPSDVVARLGGDEFVLVCPDTDVEEAARVADRLLQAVAAPVQAEHHTLRIAASVGIAVSPPLDDDAETLLKHADVAVYEAKTRGRARSQVFDHEFARQAADRRRLAADLQDALANDGLEVHYQPVLDLTTERMVGLEALARWRHPERGVVPPAVFVPLAEKHGFIAELDRWVLERACHETVAALVSGDVPATVRVAVNLSARTLDDPGLTDLVAGVVRRSGLPPDSLVLEVTETALLQNRATARASLQALRALGAGVFLDDFGTGYSSLSFLRELPVTGVKIDRSFVSGVTDREEDVSITEAILRLAHGLGLETVAEGVETVEQRDLLRRLGCASAQGFLWRAAVPMSDLADKRATARVARLRERQTGGTPSAGRRWGPITRRRPEQQAGPHRTACCLRGGLEAGQAWLVLASTARRESFARTLGSLHSDAVARGQLVELDSYDTLRRVTGSDGRLDVARFEHVVGSALRQLGTSGSEVGVHAELGHVNQPLPSQLAATDLRQRLQAQVRLGLDYGDQPADCSRHGALPSRGRASDGSAS